MNEDIKAKALNIQNLVEYQNDTVVSREVIKKELGTRQFTAGRGKKHIARHQFIRLALPQHPPGDMTLVDETDTELQHIFGLRFGSICIVKRKLCHFVTCNVVTENRSLFFRFFAFLLEVRVFVERIIRMNQKIGIEGVLLQSFFRQFRFQHFIDDSVDRKSVV